MLEFPFAASEVVAVAWASELQTGKPGLAARLPAAFEAAMVAAAARRALGANPAASSAVAAAAVGPSHIVFAAVGAAEAASALGSKGAMET